MSSRLRDQVEQELGALRRLVEEYAPFRGRPAAALNNFEVAACGAMLHSFYNGVENILKRIVVTLDGALPGGDASQKQVLSQMAQPTARRGTVLSPQLCEDLKDYLNFRHVFRSAYSFYLRWDKMEPLVTGAGPLLDRLEAEIRKFLDQVPASAWFGTGRPVVRMHSPRPFHLLRIPPGRPSHRRCSGASRFRRSPCFFGVAAHGRCREYAG